MTKNFWVGQRSHKQPEFFRLWIERSRSRERESGDRITEILTTINALSYLLSWFCFPSGASCIHRSLSVRSTAEAGLTASASEAAEMARNKVGHVLLLLFFFTNVWFITWGLPHPAISCLSIWFGCAVAGDVGGAARCECYHATASSCGIAVSSISLAQKGRTSFSSLSFLFQKHSISIVGLLAAQQLPLQLLDSKEKCCLYV